VKKALAIVLSICILCQCMVQLCVIGYYELNKGYIAKNLCENRNRPERKCCGKCYLRKQLKKVDDNVPSGKTLPNKIDKNEVVVYVLPQIIHLTQVSFSALPVYNPVHQRMHNADVQFSCFHPPAADC